nr:ABC transporter G family member 35-like [Tanacetum cinerariifolium]
MLAFEWTAAKFLWFFSINFFSFLYFTYFGMLTISVTPNEHIATIFAAVDREKMQPGLDLLVLSDARLLISHL